ncbi:MAG: carboxylating nicotinate-nucleotide diphosphorylase [Acidobacteriota bacterium]|nr:carboxylating nicotinate-nucleotide diphosphorylase [Acidobacteriota bacterium]
MSAACFPLEAAQRIVRGALEEDLGLEGDITTLGAFPGGAILTARIVFREPAVVAGLPLAGVVVTEMTRRSGHRAEASPGVTDGDAVETGAIVATLTGDARNVLAGERVMLNLIGRLSGIATMTRAATDEISGFQCSVADTRKTTPGLRPLEKYAVAVGGGENHRATLDAQVLVKDNHKELAGGLAPAVDAIVAAGHRAEEIEVEIETLDELDVALDRGCGWVLLDNMPLARVIEAVRRCRGRTRVEVSGGITPGELRPYAEAGVQRISMGCLTHGARSVDVSLEIVPSSGGH